jgi:hypothetical protein
LRERKIKKDTLPDSPGGHNKILDAAQVQAIYQYAGDRAEKGLGATKRMLFFAITHLQSQLEPPKKPPSWRWFQGFLIKSTILHTIKTKPISKQRVEIHSEEAIEQWFERELRPEIKEREI